MIRGLAVVAALAAGCLHDNGVTCSDGRFCPGALVCDDTHATCVDPAQLAVCAGAASFATCTAPGVLAGQCVDGVCLPQLCGDGQIDPGEVCDDGNTMSGDGCRADCRKVEECGDGLVDVGEACDDGNLNPADGCDLCRTTSWQASVLVGGTLAATQNAVARPVSVAVGVDGRIYIADLSAFRVWRIDTDGTISSIAGNGIFGTGADGVQATVSNVAPSAIAVDGIGRVYIADGQRVRRIDLDGIIHTIAGTGVFGSGGDGGPAVAAQLKNPEGLALDSLGRVYIGDRSDARVRRIETDGRIFTVAGGGLLTTDGVAATSFKFGTTVEGIAVDSAFDIFIAEAGANKIRRVDGSSGLIATFAGNGSCCSGGDGGPAVNASVFGPAGVAVDAQGRVAIAASSDDQIRMVVGGTISTIAGTTGGFAGDGGPATAAQLLIPKGIAFDPMGRVVAADTGNSRVRRIELDQSIVTVAGNGAFAATGDGGVATSAQLGDPASAVIDSAGDVIILDTNDCLIRKVDSAGIITTIAGGVTCGYTGDGGPASAAELDSPEGAAFDAMGRLVFADKNNAVIRRIDTAGTITTIAGTGTAGYGGDLGPATAAQLSAPTGVAIDAAGNIYIADSNNNRVREIDATTGTIDTVAGTGPLGPNGDGGPAKSAQLALPGGVAVDLMGRLLIADSGNARIRMVDGGVIDTIAGINTSGYSGDGGPATAAQLQGPEGVFVDTLGRIWIADSGNNRIRRVETDGTIVLVAGAGPSQFDGDGGAATLANLSQPTRVVTDGTGRIVIADKATSTIRQITDGVNITTLAGLIDPPQLGPVSLARLANPLAIAVAGTTAYVAGGATGTVQRVANGRVDVVAGRYPQATPASNLARFRNRGFGDVGGVAVDSARQRIYVTETTNNRVDVVDTSATAWTIATLAGDDSAQIGAAGLVDANGNAARFRKPTGLYLDSTANVLYVADTGNHAIRRIDLGNNAVTTIANAAGQLGFFGDGGPATAAQLYQPTAIAACRGDLFIADTGNNRVRRIDAARTITTVIGDGTPTSSGAGSPATLFSIAAPRGLECDATGNLFVTSSDTVRLLVADTTGTVDGTGEVQTIYGAPPRDRFPVNESTCLSGLTVTSATTLEVVDACSGLLLQLTRGLP